MASTNKTANLGLNQWVESDPFLREDANADNSRIDAAMALLQNKKAEIVKLKEIVTTAQANSVEIDVRDIAWAKYSLVVIVSRLPGSGTGALSLAPCTSQNGSTVNGIDNNGIPGALCYVGFSGTDNLTLFFPLHRSSQPPALFSFSLGAKSIYGGCCQDNSYAETTTLTIKGSPSSSYVLPGGVIEFWGVK